VSSSAFTIFLIPVEIFSNVTLIKKLFRPGFFVPTILISCSSVFGSVSIISGISTPFCHKSLDHNLFANETFLPMDKSLILGTLLDVQFTPSSVCAGIQGITNTGCGHVLALQISGDVPSVSVSDGALFLYLGNPPFCVTGIAWVSSQSNGLRTWYVGILLVLPRNCAPCELPCSTVHSSFGGR
jgi:hypothetical protein